MYLELLNTVRAKAVVHVTQQPIHQVASISWHRSLHHRC